MLKNKNIFINILLLLWQLPQVILGLVFLAIFRNKESYTNAHSNVTVWRISHKGLFGTACFSTGPFIVTVENPKEKLLRHETGHSKQSMFLGPLYHIVVSLPSICRFWVRRWCNKSHEWYLNGWPEGGNKFGAEELGGTTDYITYPEYKDLEK